MMDGITILNTIEKVVYDWGFNIWGLLLLLAGIALALASAWADMEGDSWAFLLILPTSICIVASVLIFRFAKVVDTYPVYEVTINDTVNFNEFQERYEVIEQRGQIYVIRDREESLTKFDSN